MKLLLVWLLVTSAAAFAADPVPLPVAHAHNDYEHARPLFDALDRGFCSIEADVWLADDRLLVAHRREELKPDATLESLYLKPLLARVRQNRGRVYPDGTPITLLVDLKSEADPTYAALHTLLAEYGEMLTTFGPAGRRRGAVTVVVSGNRNETAMQTQRIRFAALDGRKVHLDSDAPADFIPWISENWQQLSKWDWNGPMPDAVRAALDDWVNRVHARGRKLRFWNVPDRPAVWAALLDAGVDVIGTDNLGALQEFLLARAAGGRATIEPLCTVSRRFFGKGSRVGAEGQRGLTPGHAFAALPPSPRLRRTDRKRGYSGRPFGCGSRLRM